MGLSELSILQKNKNEESRGSQDGSWNAAGGVEAGEAGRPRPHHTQPEPDASSLPLKIYFQENIHFHNADKVCQGPN